MAYVVQKANKRWTGYYRDKTGKRRSAGTYDERSVALKSAKLAEDQGLIGGDWEPAMTLAGYFDCWLPNSDLLPITRKGYESVFRKYILPRLGSKKVNDISRRVVRELLDDLKRDNVGTATRAQVKAVLGSAFKPLIEKDLIDSNPTHGISIKKFHDGQFELLEPDDFKLILKALPNENARTFARFLVTSGCRFGEATELRVKDINFKTGEVQVRRRVSDIGAKHNNGSRFLVVPATKSGYKRSITLSKPFIKDLLAYTQLNALNEEDLLFSLDLVIKGHSRLDSAPQPEGLVSSLGSKDSEHGTLTTYIKQGCRCDECRTTMRVYRRENRKERAQAHPTVTVNTTGHLPRDTWRATWTTAVKESGIGWLPRTHDLRHANATQLLKGGVDIHEVKERLGHRSITTTERYLHRLRQQQSKAAEAVDDFLE